MKTLGVGFVFALTLSFVHAVASFESAVLAGLSMLLAYAVLNDQSN